MKSIRCPLFVLSLIAFAIGSSIMRAEPAPTAMEFEYKIDDTTYEGYLARPVTRMVSYPAVLVVHDWTGNGDFSRSQAERLAQRGYIAFAVDLYGKGVRAKDRKEASQLAGKFYKEPMLFRTRMRAALEALKQVPGVDSSRIGAMGFCFGGTAVLELVRSGAELSGAVLFHGGLKPFPSQPAPVVKTPLLILYGDYDPFVPPADLAACMVELNTAKAHYRLVGYPEAVHAFTNPAAGDDPSTGSAYNASAAKAAFSEMETFFADVFSK